jgi:hypothetical protein
MIAVLMALNAVGVFGFLTRAHLERQLAIEVVAADRAAEIEARLQVEKAKVAAQSRRASADIGPVRYLAELVAGPSVDLERAVRVLTLAIVAVFDPFAIMLLVAATGISAAPH